MSQSTRLREIIAILEARHYPVPVDVFLDELGISLSAFKRDLAVLRDTMCAPIEWVRGEGGSERGYMLADKKWSSGKLGLPNTWFTATEIYGLLMIDELASHIGPGILTEHIQPLIARISVALSAAKDAPQDIRSKIRILSSASKRANSPFFETVAQSTVKQNKLRINYFTKSSNTHSERVISPQRLIHYKENWYLVAWCHKANSLRMFALDSIESANSINEPIESVGQNLIDETVGRDFGIYSGVDRQWAKLKFSSVQAPWVQAEVWHPEQKSSVLVDGSYVIDIPFSNPKELILEILRFGPDVVVLEPPSLRQAIKERLAKAASQYD